MGPTIHNQIKMENRYYNGYLSYDKAKRIISEQVIAVTKHTTCRTNYVMGVTNHVMDTTKYIMVGQ